jgi:MFS family permease
VILTTLFFRLFGIGNWRIMAVIWSIVPIMNFFYFKFVPIYPIVSEADEPISLRNLLKMKVFWLLIVLMICAGASEQAMSQWASAFAEAGLHVSKTMGDLMGPCLFAVFMGTARALYGKFADALPLKKVMAGSAVLCIICYLTAILAKHPVPGLLGCAVCGFSVGIFWPGTFSIAALEIPRGGTAMYALLALAGDVGCSFGPSLTGFSAALLGGKLKLGLAVSSVFPLIMLACILLMEKQRD